MTDKQLSEGSWKIWLDFQNDPRNIDNPNFSMSLMKQGLIHKKKENAMAKATQLKNDT